MVVKRKTTLESQDHGLCLPANIRTAEESSRLAKKERRERLIASKKIKYTNDLPKRMYLYFLSYSEGGLPSFRKFAGSIGTTHAELMIAQGF